MNLLFYELRKMRNKIRIEYEKFEKSHQNKFNNLKMNFLINKNFTSYHEWFERSFVETCIKSGIFTKLKLHDVKDFSKIDQDFLIGNNQNVENRAKFSRQFFSLINLHGEVNFFKNKIYENTNYYIDLKTKLALKMPKNYLKKMMYNYKSKQMILKRVKEYFLMYENMKKFNSLMPNMKNKVIRKKIYLPSDLPWAIKYKKFIRHRDGSHRRSLAFYLKWKKLPTLEFQFDLIEKEFLKKHDDILYDYFPIYKKIINDRVNK